MPTVALVVTCRLWGAVTRPLMVCPDTAPFSGEIFCSRGLKERLEAACQGKGFLLCYKRGDEAVHGEHHLTLVA